MAGFRMKLLLAGLVVLGTTSSANAWWLGWRFWGYGYYGPSYYSPTYYRYYAPAYSYCPSVPVYPTVQRIPRDSAAPAQRGAEELRSPTTKEPPASNPKQKGPTVTESRSLSRDFAGALSAADRCKVGFWNLTGRDITLRVDGQPRPLAKNRAVTLDMARSFSWQVDQDRAINELVPAEQAFHEVILRQ